MACAFAFVAIALGCAPGVQPVDEPEIAPASSTPDASTFADRPGRNLVIAHCTGCHSGKLVLQNRATRQGWEQIIRWMQKKQGLWKLPASDEKQILDYLAAAYAPDPDAHDARRPPIPTALMPPSLPPRTRCHESK